MPQQKVLRNPRHSTFLIGVSYQSAKSKDYGVNLCEGCLQKQLIIDRQNQEILALKQKLKLQDKRLKEGFFASSTPSSQLPIKENSLSENQAKRGGAQPGHPPNKRHAFTPEQADEVRLLPVDEQSCPSCQSHLVTHTPNQRAIFDLQQEQLRKLFYQLERKRCSHCQTILSAKVIDAFPKAQLSNSLLVEVAQQHYVLGRTLGQISEKLSVNYSTRGDSLKRVGKLLEPCLEKLKVLYRQSQVRHADETSWRCDGGNGYSWYFGNKDVSLHLFRQTRSGSVAREVLGKEKLEGVLVVDRYAAYNQMSCALQYCYAHLLRDLKDLENEFESDQEVQSYTREMKTCLTDAMQLRNRGLSVGQYRKEAQAIKSRILALSERPSRHLGVRNWQAFYVEKAERLYQWCESAEVPAENNYAEREIRKVVIARKLSYGSQSEEGAKTREIWTSVLQTLKKREENPEVKLLEGLRKLVADKEFDIAEELFGSPVG
jgi:transposase